MKVAEFIEHLGMLPKDAELLFEDVGVGEFLRPYAPCSDDTGLDQDDKKVVVVRLTESDVLHVRFNLGEVQDGEEGQ